jgi:catechol 2,3-dioxygenase-like lactoylglutathione lyase family enzyme
MIIALDHTVLVCPDLESAIAELTLLLGRPSVWTTEADEVGTAIFLVDNTALELMAPIGSGTQADRLRQIVDDSGGPTLTSLVFASDNISDDHRRFGRRNLNPGEIVSSSSHDRGTGASRSWKRLRLSDESMAGIKTFVIEQQSDRLRQRDAAVDEVHAMDHLVVTTTHPERAVATYGGRLGLNLALDLTEEKWGARLLFFRVAEYSSGLTLEVVHRLNDPPTEQDRLWGMTWAVKDLSAAKARLDREGVTTSEIRVGRKPGSNVFTVKSHTLGVPTLFIAHQPRPAS